MMPLEPVTRAAHDAIAPWARALFDRPSRHTNGNISPPAKDDLDAPNHENQNQSGHYDDHDAHKRSTSLCRNAHRPSEDKEQERDVEKVRNVGFVGGGVVKSWILMRIIVVTIAPQTLLIADPSFAPPVLPAPLVFFGLLARHYSAHVSVKPNEMALERVWSTNFNRWVADVVNPNADEDRCLVRLDTGELIDVPVSYVKLVE